MKRILITVIAAITFFACNKSTDYTITGTAAIAEMEGSQVFLYKRVDGEQARVDSAIITNGTYTFSGSIDDPVKVMLLIGEGVEGQYAFLVDMILEKGKINIITNKERFSKVSGTKNNDLFQSFKDAQNGFYQEVGKIWTARDEAQETGNDELAQSLRDEINNANEKYIAFVIEFLKNNINNPAGRSLLGETLGMPTEKMREAISKATPATLKTAELERFLALLQALEKTDIGQPFVDFRMQDLDGNEIALSDFAGKDKYVMIDFTATWCGPCIHGKPAMIATYEKFKDKGFEIISVWLDNDKEIWIDKAKALSWFHMSDLKGWNCEAAKLYGVKAIPQSVLIDKDGIIIAKNLQGYDLDKKLTELMKP